MLSNFGDRRSDKKVLSQELLTPAYRGRGNIVAPEQTSQNTVSTFEFIINIHPAHRVIGPRI